jgi:O-antigen/teichoic acid export membrane protein
MYRIFQLLKKNKLILDTAKLVSSNVLMYILPFIVTPILSRLYQPEYFGEWGVFSSTLQILSFAIFLCYDYTIVKVAKPKLPNACILSLTISFTNVLAIIIVFQLGTVLGLRFFVNFPCKLFFYCILIFSSITTILQNIANRYENYWYLSFSNIVLGLSQALFRVVFAKIVLFDNGLIAGTTLAQLVCCIFLCWYTFKSFTINKIKYVSFDFKEIIAFAKENKKFPLYDAPATLLTFASFNMVVIILSYFYTKSQIGCLSLIHQMLLLPISLVGGAIGKVYYQQISDSKYIESNTDYSKISKKVIIFVLVISVFPTLFLVLGGDWLIDIFLGTKWIGAGKIAICLALWSVPNILTQPLLPLIRKENKQNVMFIFNLLNFVLSIGGLVLCCILEINIHLCLLIYSFISASVNGVFFAYLYKLSKVEIHSRLTILISILHITAIALLLLRVLTIL